MQESIATAKAKINAWAKQAIELQEEYERDRCQANNHRENFFASGEDAERREAIKWLGAAWKLSAKLAALKQNIAWEASVLAKVYEAKLNTEEAKTLDAAHSLKSDIEYFDNMTKKANHERDEFLAFKHQVIEEIKELRAKKTVTVAS